MENLGEMSILGENFDGGRIREDELESRSCSDNFEAASGDDLDNTNQNQHNNNNNNNQKSSKRKKYHRHTAFQIQELEA